jgi:regulator of replication initiation timing
MNQNSDLKKELSKLKIKLDAKQKNIKRLNSDLENLVLENNRLLIENKNISDEIENYHMQSAAPTQSQDNRINYWKREAIVLQNSYSFRLGQIIINGFKMPGKSTLLMPYYIVKMILDIIKGRGRDELKKALERNS